MKKYSELLLGALLASYATVGTAGALEKFYQVDTQLSYQSNPGFADTDKQSVWALRITPSAQLQYADELNQYNLNVGFSVYQNSNEDVLLNYVAPQLSADWSRELEFGQVGLEAKYDEFAARAESLRLNGNNANVENKRKTAAIKGIFNIDFNGTYSLRNTAEYTDVSYSETTNDLNDYDVAGASAQLIRKQSDRFSMYAKLDYSELSPETESLIQNGVTNTAAGVDSDVYGLVVGGIYTPSEDIKVDFAIGGYDTSGRFDDSGVKIESNGYYNLERVQTYFNVYRKMLAGGNGIFQINEFFNVGGIYQLSEVSNLGLNVARNKTEPDNSISDFDVTYESVMLSYERTYEDWKAKAYVDFVGLDLNGDDRRQNVVGFIVSYDPFDFNDLRRNPLNF